MGIPGLLPRLADAGRAVDLRDYDFRRLGIDVSTWVYQACQGYGEMLGDERHVTFYGRAELLSSSSSSNQQQHDNAKPMKERQQQPSGPSDATVQEFIACCTTYVVDKLQNIQQALSDKCCILVVLDGATPPIKTSTVRLRAQQRQEYVQRRDQATVDDNEREVQKRRQAFRRAGAGHYYAQVLEALLVTFRQHCVPFLVAPYESDGQLAYLAHQGYLDLVITEDSDLVAYGVPVLFKMVTNLKECLPMGTLLLPSEWCFAHDADLPIGQFTPAVMAVLCVASGGSDYPCKLAGIGLKTAAQVVYEVFVAQEHDSPLDAVMTELWNMGRGGNQPDDYRAYRVSFLHALNMYRCPVVFDPIRRACVRVPETDAVLLQCADYAALCRNDALQDAISGVPFPAPLCTFIAEGWIHPRTLKPRVHDVSELPSCVKAGSERMPAVEALISRLLQEAAATAQDDDDQAVDGNDGSNADDNDEEAAPETQQL